MLVRHLATRGGALPEQSVNLELHTAKHRTPPSIKLDKSSTIPGGLRVSCVLVLRLHYFFAEGIGRIDTCFIDMASSRTFEEASA